MSDPATKPNRRQFVVKSTQAAAAISLPYFVPASALANRYRPGANDRVAIGLIGMGQRGNQLVQNIPESGFVTAICDVDCNKSAAAKKNPVHAESGQDDWRVFQDYRDMLDDSDIDAVMVSAADHHHVLASMLACQAGKDVYCEKPLSLYVREGRALVEAARKYDRIVQTGTQQRSMEMNRFACEFVRSGGVGKIHAVECVNFGSPKPYPAEGLPEEPVPEGVDWELWQGQAPARPFNRQLFSHWSDGHGNWWGNWIDYSNSQLTGLGSHAFDMVQYAVGADDSGPVEFWPIEKGPNAKIHFRYGNGIEVRLRFADARPYVGPRNGAIFVGEDCKIEINRNKYTTNPSDFIKGGPDPGVAARWEGEGWIAKGHVQNWLDCIRTRERPHADVEIGHRTASLCQLLLITRLLDRRLTWDPVREIFPDDDQATALLDRPRRKGWELPPI